MRDYSALAVIARLLLPRHDEILYRDRRDQPSAHCPSEYVVPVAAVPPAIHLQDEVATDVETVQVAVASRRLPT